MSLSKIKRKVKQGLFEAPFTLAVLEWDKQLGYHYPIHDKNGMVFDRLKLNQSGQETMMEFKARARSTVQELNKFIEERL